MATTIDLARWRAEFPSCAELVHMNHAGIAPIPRPVANAVHKFADQALRFGLSAYAAWESRVEEVREAMARLIGAQSAEIAFIRNTSEGLSLVAAGLEWTPGDNVVAMADEYPANVYPWWGLRRWGVETRLVPRPQLRFGVQDVARLVDARTRIVAVSAVDWQSGFRADLAALGEFCRARGILFCVDGIQAVGALWVDVEAAGIDCMAMGGHKWLLAPEGCGALFVSRRIVERLQPVLLGWKSVEEAGRYLPYHFDLRRDAARFEEGTLPHLGIHALGSAVDLLLEVGPGSVEARVLEVTATLADGLRERGASILSPERDAERSGILTFRLGDTAALLATLSAAGIRAQQRLGGIRLSPHFYNDQQDVDRLLAAVGSYRRDA